MKTFKLDVNIPVSKAELDSNWAKLYENCVSHNHNIMKTASVVFTSNIIQYNDITLSWLVCITHLVRLAGNSCFDVNEIKVFYTNS